MQGSFRDSENEGGASRCEAGDFCAVLQFVAHQVELFVSSKEAAHVHPDAQEEAPALTQLFFLSCRTHSECGTSGFSVINRAAE